MYGKREKYLTEFNTSEPRRGDIIVTMGDNPWHKLSNSDNEKGNR